MKFIRTFIISICFAISGAKMMKLTSLKFKGYLRLSTTDFLPKQDLFTIYLSQQKLDVIETTGGDENYMILCDVIPIIVDPRDGSETLSEIELNHIDHQRKQNVDLIDKLITAPQLSVHYKDGGLFDRIPYDILKASKRALYDKLSSFSNDRNSVSKSPIKITADIIESICHCKVTRLIIDEEDDHRDFVSLGGCVQLVYNGTSDDGAEFSPRELFVDCFVDEVVSLSLALNLPIFMDEQLVNSLSIDAKISSDSSSQMIIKAPISDEHYSNVKNDRSSKNVNIIPLAWEIYDPKVFFQLSNLDKREILRKSGVKHLPKPRHGTAALDRVLLDLMDDSVRNEIYRIQSRLPTGAIENAAASRESVLALMGKALESGDMEKAEQLREKFQMMTILRADPTQQVGAYDRYLDQDDWYMQARRAAMAPKKTDGS